MAMILQAAAWSLFVFGVSGRSVFGEEFAGEDSLETLELGGGFGGSDMVMIDDMIIPASQAVGRSSVVDELRPEWESGTIIVHITKGDFSEAGAELIRATWRHIENRTCLKFVESAPSEDERPIVYVRTKSDSRCYAGYAWRHVNLASGCMSPRLVQHETLHALGFWHEQMRPDRDKYVTIHWDNIQKRQEGNFAISPNSVTFDQPYNYNSVMHYRPYDFAIDPYKPTISPKNDTVVINPGEMNDLDFQAVNLLFKCKAYLVPQL